MFPDNNFTRDTHEEHYQRVQLCAQGVATYDGELSFRPSWVTEITAYPPEFEALLNSQNLEDADWHGSIAALEAARNILYEFNSSARWMVKTILDDPTMDSGILRQIDDAFDIDEKLSKGFMNLTRNTRKLLHGQEVLEDISAPWTLPDAMVTNLTDGVASVETLADTAEKEHGEKLRATDDVYAKREIGENLLRNIFRWVVANWGHNDPRMLEFGFVPTSQIVTPGQPAPGVEWPDWPGPVVASAEQIDEGLVRITYSGLNGGKTLRIDRLKQGDADYVLVTDGLPLDDPEEVMPFDDNHLDKKKYTYKLTPFDEVGNPGTPALVEVTVR